MSELEQLRQEAEQLRNQIRVSGTAVCVWSNSLQSAMFGCENIFLTFLIDVSSFDLHKTVFVFLWLLRMPEKPAVTRHCHRYNKSFIYSYIFHIFLTITITHTHTLVLLESWQKKLFFFSIRVLWSASQVKFTSKKRHSVTKGLTLINFKISTKF